MAKPAAQDEPVGMEKGELKRHLRFAREEPISVAFAIGGDGKAIIQMHRRKPGRALEKQLKDEAPDAKNHRWGTVTIDPDDEKTARFTINKAGGGLARRLIVALKGTGFNKVKLLGEDGAELESEQGEEEEEQEAADAGAGLGAAAGRMAEPPAGEAGAGAGVAAAAQQAAGPDTAVLEKQLAGLVKRMLTVIAKDPSQKAALTELAIEARANLKRPDPVEASAAVDIFKEAIEDAEKALPASANPTAASPATNSPATNGAAANGPAAGNGQHAQTAEKGGAAAAPDLRKEGEQILAALMDAVKKAMPLATAIPGLGDLVKTVVAAVQNAVKAGEIQAAHGHLGKLLEAIASGSAGAAAGGKAAHGDHEAHKAHAAKHAPAIDKAGNVWGATLQKITTEVDKLEKAFAAALSGHGMAGDLTKTLRGKLDGTLHHLDERLKHALADVNKAPNAAERAKHVEHAHKLIEHYQKHVSSDPTIQMLDRNPFAPIAISQTVMASLTALQRTIR